MRSRTCTGAAQSHGRSLLPLSSISFLRFLFPVCAISLAFLCVFLVFHFYSLGQSVSSKLSLPFLLSFSVSLSPPIPTPGPHHS